MKRLFTIFSQVIVCLFFSTITFAQQKNSSTNSSSVPAVAWVMLSLALLFAGVIYVLGKVVFIAYKNNERRIAKLKGTILPIILFISITIPWKVFAQDETEAVKAVATGPYTLFGMPASTFYLLLSGLILEMIIITFLARMFYHFSGLKKEKIIVPETELIQKKKFRWLEKMMNTKSVDPLSEEEINLGHDYDGIGELDNPTPPWWQWGFVASIIFAIIYLYTHLVSHSAPNQLQELAFANQEAAEKQKLYLETSAGNVDENTAVYLSDPTDLAEGKSVFTSVCAACHGADGGGIVGPNLTDDYWLHGGSIKEIFKTIKYGVPEKGMKSWKDDYPPKKIEQIASYIHSIHGTKPTTPKAPQGDIYKDSTAVNSVVTDSLK
ncbi:MAG: cbb3-type cytochrome c oxidase N-terminal domain-containing protein [Bacteroidota bacterium]